MPTYPQPDSLPLFVVIGLLILPVVVLAVTARYLIVSGRFDPLEAPVKCRQQRDQLKYIGIISVATGAFAMIYMVYRVFIETAIAGGRFDETFDKIIGPLGEALIPLAIGLFNLILSLICMMLVLARNSCVATRKAG